MTGHSCRRSFIVSRGLLDRLDVQLLELAGSTVPGAPVIKSVPLAVLGNAMQSRIFVSPE